MSDPIVRIAVVVLAAVAALALGWVARIVSRKQRPTLDVSQLISERGVVVFTKDDCPNCAAVLEMLEPGRLPVRQIRAETEPEIFEHLAIDGVPVTVVVAEHGRHVAQFSGLPRRAALQRALRRVGETPSTRVSGL